MQFLERTGPSSARNSVDGDGMRLPWRASEAGPTDNGGSSGVPRQPHRDRVYTVMEANSRKSSRSLERHRDGLQWRDTRLYPHSNTWYCCQIAFRRARQAQPSGKPRMQKVHASDATSDALQGMSDCSAQTHISILFRLYCFTPVDLYEDDRSVHDPSMTKDSAASH